MARRCFAVFAAAIVLTALAAHTYFARPRTEPSRRTTPRQPETAVVGDAPSCGLEQLCGLCGHHNTTAVAVSLVAVVRDRAESLLRVLPSWARVAGVGELVLVDWGSSPPLRVALRAHAFSDARLRLVRAPHEREWNLARAYNLAAMFARGETLLKVDSDTWLSPSFLAGHPLRADGFYAGDWRRAPDENAWHLNGIVLVRRAHFAAVGGYDERIRRYGYDDTDLYARLVSALALNRSCIDYTLISHVGTGHADRGQTWVNEFYNRRAVEAVWPRWHASRLLPSTWALDGGADGERCAVRCVRRPPFLDELAAAGERGLAATAWRAAYASAIHKAAGDALSPPALQRVGERGDYEALLRIYENLAFGGARYLAVHATGTLAERLGALCSARAIAAAHGLRLVLVWPADGTVRADFEELFDLVPAAFEVLRHFDAALFPPRFWAVANATAGGKIVLPAKSRSLLVHARAGAGGVLFAEPPLPPAQQQAAMRRCMRSLRPAAAVRTVVDRHAAAAERSVGVHACDGRAAAVDDWAMVGARTTLAAAEAELDAAEAAAAMDARDDWAGDDEVGARRPAAAAAAGGGGAAADVWPRRWHAECSHARAVAALASFRDNYVEHGAPMPSFFVVLEPPEAWPAFAARAAAAGVPPLFGLGDERARARCLTRSAQRTRRCAVLAAAELWLLARATTLVRSVGCTASAVATYLLPPATPLRTACVPVKAADAAAFAALHPLDDTGASAAAAAPPPRGDRERANGSRPHYFAGGATFAEIAAVLT